MKTTFLNYLDFVSNKDVQNQFLEKLDDKNQHELYLEFVDFLYKKGLQIGLVENNEDVYFKIIQTCESDIEINSLNVSYDINIINNSLTYYLPKVLNEKIEQGVVINQEQISEISQEIIKRHLQEYFSDTNHDNNSLALYQQFVLHYVDNNVADKFLIHECENIFNNHFDINFEYDVKDLFKKIYETKSKFNVKITADNEKEKSITALKDMDVHLLLKTDLEQEQRDEILSELKAWTQKNSSILLEVLKKNNIDLLELTDNDKVLEINKNHNNIAHKWLVEIENSFYNHINDLTLLTTGSLPIVFENEVLKHIHEQKENYVGLKIDENLFKQEMSFKNCSIGLWDSFNGCISPFEVKTDLNISSLNVSVEIDGFNNHFIDEGFGHSVNSCGYMTDKPFEGTMEVIHYDKPKVKQTKKLKI